MKKLSPIFDKVNNKALLYVGLVIVGTGVILDQKLPETNLGTVLIIVGALFLILTKFMKRTNNQNEEEKDTKKD